MRKNKQEESTTGQMDEEAKHFYFSESFQDFLEEFPYDPSAPQQENQSGEDYDEAHQKYRDGREELIWKYQSKKQNAICLEFIKARDDLKSKLASVEDNYRGCELLNQVVRERLDIMTKKFTEATVSRVNLEANVNLKIGLD